MTGVPTFRDQAETFRQLARESADPAIRHAALEVAAKLELLAQAIETTVKRGRTSG
jgi:hypothetical protein